MWFWCDWIRCIAMRCEQVLASLLTLMILSFTLLLLLLFFYCCCKSSFGIKFHSFDLLRVFYFFIFSFLFLLFCISISCIQWFIQWFGPISYNAWIGNNIKSCNTLFSSYKVNKYINNTIKLYFTNWNKLIAD